MPGTNATLAVSTVIFALRPSPPSSHRAPAPTIWVPLVRRQRQPFIDLLALPGGPLGDEDLAAAASRTLFETMRLAPKYLEQLYAFGDADRVFGSDPRVVSVVYWALVGNEEASSARLGDNVRWHPVDSLPPLAFDHRRIIDYALWRLRNKVEYSSIAHSFLGESFTLAQLREVYEAVLDRPLDAANFRRDMLASQSLAETGETLAGTRHRPPKLYRYLPQKDQSHDNNRFSAHDHHAHPDREAGRRELLSGTREVAVGVRPASSVLRAWGVNGRPAANSGAPAGAAAGGVPDGE
ncbi:8-oxo-dGTP diphosphatase [Pseudoclavibacter helvolus]|uniref:8-oxo-dGTP diphosphatase n=1 Tax=Pseudoclavibacter helvolus TaxID=255205 RepID=A0A7W4YG20_9MICO|nr:8-oxo-dGTP diphosphatase [Pseudoclavibacter helvolus]